MTTAKNFYAFCSTVHHLRYALLGWCAAADLFTRAVDILVSRMRRKLEPLEALKTLRNAGYCFALPPRGEGGGGVPCGRTIRLCTGTI